MSNDSTINSFEELGFPSLLKKYDKILIPMIQRDYAQGRTDKKAQEVRTNLLNDIFDKNKVSVHFDLIFGSCEKRKENDGEKHCFIPVDGQQRLTTLFLLYLYYQKKEQCSDGVDLSKFCYDTRRAAADFCKNVTSEDWTIEQNGKVSGIIKDSVWFMNYWENDPTVAGMLNMLDNIHEKAKENEFPCLEKVKFYFFDLESNGLNENLYLKMNSRGKPLTAFENLKASIEKELPNKEFAKKWKYNIDRGWTNAFWNNDKPEETDKNITAFIVRFLSGYYNAFCNSNDENIVKETDKLKEINSRSNYADFIPFEPIKKSLQLPEAFQRLALAFSTIVNKEVIKPNWNEIIRTTDLHEYKIIAVVFAYVLFNGNPHAMRVAWNLAENTVSGYDNFIAYCKRIGEIFSNHIEKEDDIYQILAQKEFKNPSAQLTEEIAKAKKINEESSWESKIIEAEKYAFFRGAIRFLFTDGTGAGNWNDFNTKWENAQKYFDKNGVKETYRTNAYLLRYYISKFNEWWMFWDFPYNNEPTTWKSILTSNRFVANHKILIQTPENLDLSKFNASLDKYDEGYKEWQNNVQNDLVKTTLLVEASQWSSKLNWRNDTYSLYPYNNRDPKKIYVIANKRNTILSGLIEKHAIESSQKLYCDFFHGWDINFKYLKDGSRPFYFQWNTDEKIYLLENGLCKTKKVNPQEYYCFNVSGVQDKKEVLQGLNSLIDEAIKIGDLQ